MNNVKMERNPKINSPRRLVITVHGIRTYGRWQEQLGSLLESHNAGISVHHFKYGYFSALAFIIPFTRWLMTRRFRKDFINIATGSSWDRIDIVAHSFGTHLVAWALYRILAKHHIKINTIILSGSVLKSGYPWRELMGPQGDVSRVVNDCGVRDNVLLLNQIFVLGTGMAGRTGFSGLESQIFVNRYFDHGHSGYFDGDFMERHWLSLLLTENPVNRIDERPPSNAWRGLLTFTINNIDPIKLVIYISPFIYAVLYVNGLRVQAVEQRNEAVQQVKASTAYAYSLRDPTLAIQLAVDVFQSSEEVVTSSLAMLKAFNSGSWFYSHRFDNSWSADISPDGEYVAWIPEGGKVVRLEKLGTGVINELQVPATRVRFSPNGNILAWTGAGIWGEELSFISLFNMDGELLEQWTWDHYKVHFESNGFAAVVSSTEDHKRVLLIIDTKDGTVTTSPFDYGPNSKKGQSDEVVVFDNGRSFFVAEMFPDQVTGSIDGNVIPALDIPIDYRIADIAVDSEKRIVVMVLMGSFRGVTDAIAWAPFDASGVGVLKMLHMPNSIGEAGAKLRVLPDHRILATSTSGWTRIVDLDTRNEIAIDQSRGFDALAFSDSHKQFVMARRSGDVSLYDYSGNKTGVLLAETGSDGLNPQFKHIRFSEDGSKVLTQSKRTTRVWLRPKYNLSKAYDETFRPNQNEIANIMLNNVANTFDNLGDMAKPSRYMLNDTGMYALPINYSGRPDYLPAYLSKEDFRLSSFTNWKEGVWKQNWSGRNMDRIFVLSPEIIRAVIEDEVTQGRLWRPASANLEDWVSMISG